MGGGKWGEGGGGDFPLLSPFTLLSLLHTFVSIHVCVCERERERESPIQIQDELDITWDK